MGPNDSLRIIHVLNHVGRASGNVCAMVDLACTQAALGHQVYVCSAGGYFEELLLSRGIVHIKIEVERKAWGVLKAVAKMTASFSKLKPDIVHAHMMGSAVLSAIIRPLLRFKLVTTVHNEFEKKATLMGLGQRVIAVSDAVRYSMIHRGVSSKKVRTVLNGTIGSPRFPKEIVPILLPNHPAIIFVGGLHPRKGVDDLIYAHAEVIKTVASAHLYIIGSGPFKETYQNLAKSIAQNSVTFCGHIEDPRTYLASSEIFALPSHADPAPLIVSEAREAGCAIVASNVGGVPELVEGGKAGVLVPPKRPDLLAEAILALLLDPAYLADMRNCSQYNIEKLSLSRVAKETVQVYRELL